MAKISYISKLFNADFVDDHEHGVWELVYCTRGNGKTVIDGEEFTFCKGEMLIIPPFVKHGDKSECRFDNIHLTVTALSIGITKAVKIIDNNSEAIYSILNLAHIAYHKKENNYINLLNSLYDVLINYILSFIKSAPENDYIQMIEDSIIENISNPHFIIKDLLSTLPHNPEYLRQKFVEQKSVSPTRYLTQKRMEYAKLLLNVKELSQLTIKEIASLCGYEDPLYFSRIFKKYTGQNPCSYAGG